MSEYAFGSQKSASDPWTWSDVEPPDVDEGESNLGSLEEQQVLSGIKPSLPPLYMFS